MTEAIRARASGLWELWDCARRWVAKHRDGITMPASVPAHIGTSLHAATAAYDGARLAGEPFTVDDAAARLVGELANPEEEVADWGEANRRRAEATGLALLSRYCADYAPQQHFVAVELELEPLTVDCGNGLALRLTGTLDRVREVDGRQGIVDIKSGVRAVDADGEARTQGHGIQLGVYELLYEATSGAECALPAQILGLQTTNNWRIGAGEIVRPRDALIGTDEEPGLLQHAANLLSLGETHHDFPGNSHSMLCSPQYCPVWNGCPFKL